MLRRPRTFYGGILLLACLITLFIFVHELWGQADDLRKAQQEMATQVAGVAKDVAANKKVADDSADALDAKVADLEKDIAANKKTTDDRADALAKTQDQSSIDAVSIYEDVRESICAVLVPHEALPVGTCFLHGDDMHVLTPVHLVKQADPSRIRVQFGTDEPVKARIAKRNDGEDLVLLELDRAQEGRKPLLLADDVVPGQWVVVFGQLYGRFLDSMRVAMVSGLHRDSNDPQFFKDCPTCTGAVQIDIYTDDGSSGGPVVRSDRKVVGMVRGGVGDVTLLVSVDTIRKFLSSVKGGEGVDF